MIQHGQMMGIYLSFPLLCCHSYTAARWASRGDSTASYLVNGDDTAIAGQEPVPADAYPVGYQLNDKKTVRSRTVVELNSTVFLKKRGSWKEVQNLRRGGFDPTTYAGMLHGAEACLWSGRVWVDAFMRSRIGSRWGFLPSQLGFFDTKSYLAFKRERKMRCDLGRSPSAIPARLSCRSDLLQMRTGAPDPDEVHALVLHQWHFGRDKEKRETELRVSVGEFRKSCIRTVCKSGCLHCLATRRLGKLRVFPSYLNHLAGLPLSTHNKRRVYFVPAGYISQREKAEIACLSFWKDMV
jgi:hypothetical protein